MWIEYAASNGPGTLVFHGIREIIITSPTERPHVSRPSFHHTKAALRWISEQEAYEFIDRHGSTVAVAYIEVN